LGCGGGQAAWLKNGLDEMLEYKKPCFLSASRVRQNDD
jgi:hypothetical protein